MKVGLLSMHRVYNFGSFWQAYCLMQMLKANGASDVEFIDIIPGQKDTVTHYKKKFSFSKIKRIPYYMFQKKKANIFRGVQASKLGLKDTMNYSTDYDAIVIGSDEVFHFTQSSPWGLSTQLFGGMDHDHISTYAACFGSTTMDKIVERGALETIKGPLTNIKNISVRDDNSSQIISKILDREPEVNLDPVVVGDLPLDEIGHISDDKYILVYSYDFRFADPQYIKAIRAFAKDKGYKVYSVGFYQDWVDKNIICDPYELLAYFKDASYIVTDTFHGTIFSARLHKQFVTVIRDTNKQKLTDLLSRLGMEARMLDEEGDFEAKLTSEIDYESFEKLRADSRRCSDEYLSKCLSV